MKWDEGDSLSTLCHFSHPSICKISTELWRHRTHKKPTPCWGSSSEPYVFTCLAIFWADVASHLPEREGPAPFADTPSLLLAFSPSLYFVPALTT